ncbi:iron-sulfur protein required for NADH dehydrogenase, mitochondrial-like, partial [Rosa sericea]
NLAIALANKCGMKVGLLDAYVYGPNVPIMMKLEGKPKVTKGSVEHEKGVTASQFQSYNHFANASVANGI